jgi:hypothetical protein
MAPNRINENTKVLKYIALQKIVWIPDFADLAYVRRPNQLSRQFSNSSQ